MRILKKILKWTGIVIGGLLILSIIVHTVLNIVWGRELRAKLAELKAKGEPITIAEIRPAPVPDNENAAVLYNKVFMLMTSGEGGKPYIPNEDKGKINRMICAIEDVKSFSDISKWTEKQRREISKLVNSSDMQYIYALLEQASKRPECNFNLKYENGASVLLPHLSRIRTLARLLCAKALIEAHSGNPDKASETILVGLRISNHLKNETTLISQLVRIACDMIMINCIEPLSDKYSISQEKMKYIVLELEKHSGTEPFKKCMDAERVIFGGIEFNKLLNRKYSTKDWKALFSSGGETFPKLFYLIPTFPFRPILKKDFVCYLTFLSEMKELYDIPYSESVIAGKNPELKLKTGIPSYCIFTKMLLPALTRIRELMSIYEAQIQVCRIGLGLKIYKAKYGTYPESLAKLVPDILEEIPSDPFTEKNLVYRKSKDGFVLYSLGPNMKDDGGTARPKRAAKPDDERKAKKNYDIVWKCEK
ncbi:hypothetical protein KAW08_01630 [bacterium]|nr:hypothetical protein [bacterium]